MVQIFTTLKTLVLHRGYFPCGFMDNYMPAGDVKSFHERDCNEGRCKRSHQREYLKWDLQEPKDLLGKIDCSNSSAPQVVVFSVKLYLLPRCISFSNQSYGDTWIAGKKTKHYSFYWLFRSVCSESHLSSEQMHTRVVWIILQALHNI